MPILYHQPRGIAPKWLEPIKRARLSVPQQRVKREKNNLLTWNRRLSKAGNGARVGADLHKRYHRFSPDYSTYALPIVQEQPELKYLQAYRIRKDRSKNGYRTERKFEDEQMTDRPERESVFWVQDIRTKERVADLAILKAVVAVVNDSRKWPYVLDEPTKRPSDPFEDPDLYKGEYAIGKPSRKSRRAMIVFDKPGPERLTLHQLGIPEQCGCWNCRSED